MGESGAATGGVQNTSTLSDLPDWFKAPEMGLAKFIGQQAGDLSNIANIVQGGGTAPANGIFTGGATTTPFHPQVNPQGAFGPFTPSLQASQGGPFDPQPLPKNNFKSNFGGNGAGSGIGGGALPTGKGY